MIEFKSLSHKYNGKNSLLDVGFSMQQGEVVSLLGPSGCGKTTLLRLAAGLEVPESGEIVMDGQIISRPGWARDPELRHMGMVFQSYALFPHLKVLDNVLFGMNDKGAKATRNALDMLAELNIEHLGDMYPHELSGGQQQRVALARALAPKPRLLLLDEPFSGLDSRLRERVRDQMLHTLREHQVSALMVTHDSEEAMFLSDKIIVLNNGSVEQQGRPIDLYARPKTSFVAGFFGEVNHIPGIVSGDQIDTIFGSVGHAGLSQMMKDGHQAEVVVRYEGISCHAEPTSGQSGTACKAYVMEARQLGHATLVHLSVPTGTASLHVHARIPGLNHLDEGQALYLSIDPSQLFVFPSENGH